MERFTEIGRKWFCLQTMMQITGNQMLRIENCRRILEYNDIRIVLQTTDLQLSVWGKNLQVDAYATDAVLIHGELQAIELAQKGGRLL
jgi:sporulation protein YqfC